MFNFSFFKKKKKVDDYKKEVDMNNGIPISFEKMCEIKDQMTKCICEIKCIKEGKGKGHGTGFFCKIPFPNSFHLLPALITNNHVLGEKDIAEGSKINMTLNSNNNKGIDKIILIDNSRKTYTNTSFDVTIIELKFDDNFTQEQFLEIDDKINVDNFDIEYKSKDVYLIGNNFSYGKISRISIENYNIYYKFSTKSGMSGSPILNMHNSKVIGVHKGGNEKFNLGTFIRQPIKEFNEKYLNLKVNQAEKQEKENNNKINIDNNNKFNIDNNNDKINIDNYNNDKINIDNNNNDKINIVNNNKINIKNNKIQKDISIINVNNNNNKINFSYNVNNVGKNNNYININDNQNKKDLKENNEYSIFEPKNEINKINIYENKDILYDESPIIKDQIINGICKIKAKNKQYVIGFLCNISINSNLYSLLITYNNALGKDDIIPGKSVKFSLNNDNNNFEIFLDDERFLYTDSYITIIEIMDYDNLDKNCFLQIDDNIYQSNLFQIFRYKPVYLLHYSNDTKKVILTTGIIKSIYDENFYIKFDLNKSSNLLYGPIFDSKSYKIISMYGGNSNKDSIKLGLFIHNAIKIFEVFKREKIEEYQQYLYQLKQIKNHKETYDIDKEKIEIMIQRENDDKEREKNKKIVQKENEKKKKKKKKNKKKKI